MKGSTSTSEMCLNPKQEVIQRNVVFSADHYRIRNWTRTLAANPKVVSGLWYWKCLDLREEVCVMVRWVDSPCSMLMLAEPNPHGSGSRHDVHRNPSCLCSSDWESNSQQLPIPITPGTRATQSQHASYDLCDLYAFLLSHLDLSIISRRQSHQHSLRKLVFYSQPMNSYQHSFLVANIPISHLQPAGRVFKTEANCWMNA